MQLRHLESKRDHICSQRPTWDPQELPSVRLAIGRAVTILVFRQAGQGCVGQATKESPGGVAQALCTLARLCLPHSGALSAASPSAPPRQADQ